jgi:hypothetical protein
MTGHKRTSWRRYVDDLYRAPECSMEREIAERVTGMSQRSQIIAYLDSVMRHHPEGHRRYEIACELRHLMTGTST